MENGPPPSLPQGHRLSCREWLMALAVAVAATALALGFCRQRGLFCDEYLTWNATIRPIPVMIQDRLEAGHSPLYFFWARLGPMLNMTSEVAMRLTSAVPLFFSVLGLAWLAVVLGLRRHLAPILAMALLSPNWFTDGTTYRYMMTLIVVALFVLASAFRYAEQASLPRGAALAGTLGLALWIHASAQFLALGLLIFIAWEAFREAREAGAGRAWRAPGRVWPVGGAVLASLPLLYIIRNHSSYLKREMVDPDALGSNILEVAFGDYQLWPRFFHADASLVLAAECAVLAAALWLARATLLKEGRGRVWRLILCLLGAIPGALGVSALLVRNFQGPARYLTVLSIPFIVVLGVAWNAPVSRRRRWAFRGALAGVLLFQLSGTVLDRGDRHREAIQFIVDNYTPGDPILFSGVIPNRAALQFYGKMQFYGEKTKMYPSLAYAGDRSPVKMARYYAKALKAIPARRGFFISYYNRYDIAGAVYQMAEDKSIVAYRLWEPSSFVAVGAFVRDAREAAWLDGLDGPKMLWGPDRTPKE